MVRKTFCDKNGLRKGAWTPEEDKKLIAYVTRYGCWNWRQLPKFAGLARCGKSCRLRWLNYLRPDIKRGNFSQQEEETIIKLHENLGNRWTVIAAHLPRRTDNEVKNHWHNTLKKRFVQNKSETKRGTKKTKDSKSKEEAKQLESMLEENTSPSPSSSGFSSISTDTAAATTTTYENSVIEDNDLPFLDAYMEAESGNFWTESYMIDTSYVPPSEAAMGCEPEYFSPVRDFELWSYNNLEPEFGGGLLY